MNSFSDGAPRSYMEWLELGYPVIPCSPEGVPLLKEWGEKIINLKTHSKIFPKHYWNSGVIGVRLDELVFVLTHLIDQMHCPNVCKYVLVHWVIFQIKMYMFWMI